MNCGCRIVEHMGGSVRGVVHCPRHSEENVARLLAEIERLQGVLQRIDGGDHYCTDESKLRQWAYEGLTLGRSAEDLSPCPARTLRPSCSSSSSRRLSGGCAGC